MSNETGQYEDDIEQRSFSAAVYEQTFEEMKGSPYVTVMDYHHMGSMPEYDVYVSLVVNCNVKPDMKWRA